MGKSIKCPICGKSLKLGEGETSLKCQSCGTALKIDYENKKIIVEDGHKAKNASKEKVTSDNPRAEKRKKMHRKNVIIIVSVIVGALLLIFGIVKLLHLDIWIADKFFHPGEDTEASIIETVPSVTKDGSDTEKPEPPEQNGDEVYNFLICGYDRVAMLTDVSMIVSFNVTKLTVNVMQIPRDTYVTYYNEYGYPNGYHKANGIFSYIYSGNTLNNEKVNSRIEGIEDPAERGIAGYAAFLERNLCIRIRYYAVMDLEQFANIVDALGGVDMYVPQNMYYNDPGQNLYINLNEGYQTLNGKQSEQIVRYRATYPMGDIGRGNVQKLFMASLMKTFKSKVNMFNFNNLATLIKENLVTNMSTSDMVYFLTFAKTVDLQYVHFMTIPGWFYNEYNSDGMAVSYYSICKEAAMNFVNLYFNATDSAITPEQFDYDGFFYTNSVTYSLPADQLEYEYNWSAQEMTDEAFQPDR